jgi:hypothetical protein
MEVCLKQHVYQSSFLVFGKAEPENKDEGVVEGKVRFHIWQPPKRSGNVCAARPTDFIYVCSLPLLVNYLK